MRDDTLDRARSGDEQAFGRLTEPFRRELHVHCYRMLGSLDDAEDVVQETLLAAWRGLADFEQRSSVRTWLYRIATNRCLNAVRDGRRRPRPAPVPPFAPPEPTSRDAVTWLQPYPDALLEAVGDRSPGPEARWQTKEAVGLAFVEAVQRLPPRQAAVLVLRDVLALPTTEVAAVLGTTPTAVKAGLQRARETLERDGVRPRRQTTPADEHQLARRFADAFSADDVDGVVALLTDDAWLAMPPAPHRYRGPAAIATFLRASAAWRPDRRMLLAPTRANRQPAFACWLTDAAGGAVPAGAIVLEADGDRIRRITRFLDPRTGRLLGASDHSSAGSTGDVARDDHH